MVVCVIGWPDMMATVESDGGQPRCVGFALGRVMRVAWRRGGVGVVLDG
jgi:hypothetical protein